MKNKPLYLIILIILSCCAPVSSYAEALTLKECYALALKQSETIAINKETIKEAEAHFLQSLGTLLPHVAFSSTEYWKDLDDSSALYSKTAVERKFNFKQTLFSGFKEFEAIAGSRSERKQRVNETKRAEQLLLVDVANAFYLLVEEQEDLKTLYIARGVLINRINELRKREQLGRSRQSEVVNARTQLYNVEAEIQTDKSQIIVARQLLEFLTGTKIGEVLDTESRFIPLGSENECVLKMASRPDVEATRQAWELAKKNAGIARSGLLPTVTAEGNTYTDRTTQPNASKWDAYLKLDVPIFEGTETYGAIKLANAQAREAELQFRQTKRLAVQDIEDSYEKFNAGIKETNILKKAFMSARMNYKLQKSDYKLNLVSNLDVLQAIQTAQDSKRALIHSVYDTKRLYWQLCAAVGEATMERLDDAFRPVN